jgi:predicted DsbA family dithiol-disulfide isomerase
MTKPLKIELFSDPACPWCLLGLTRLDRALARLPAGTEVDVEHHPFLLDANASEEGEDVREMLKRKYGRDPDDMWDRLEAEANKSGLDLNMRKQKMRYATQGAQMLIRAARRKGTQHEIAMAFSHAYYLDGCNVADPEVLKEIGTVHGFTADEVAAILADKKLRQSIEADAASASAQGVTGVPFFIFAGRFALSGAQPEEVFEQVLEAALGGEGGAAG